MEQETDNGTDRNFVRIVEEHVSAVIAESLIQIGC